MPVTSPGPPPARGAAFLGVSLYLKLVVAATLLMGGAALAGAFVAGEARAAREAPQVEEAPGHPPPILDPRLKGWFALGVLGVAGLNALLIHIALHPLRAVSQVVGRVEKGDLTGRIPLSRLADRETLRVIHTLNRMLNALALNRERELQLAARLAEAEEVERRRLAHALFDGTAQRLSAALLHLHLARRDPARERSLETAREELLAAMQEIGGVARGLHPPELEELGATRAVALHLRRRAEEGGVSVRVEGGPLDPYLSAAGATALYKVLREGVDNAVEHGQPRSLRLHYALLPQHGVATLHDDGRGFDPLNLEEAPGDHLGLLRMREWARHAGGALEVDSSPGSGTRLRLTLPRVAAPRAMESG